MTLGTIYAVLAYLMWGALPLYWKLLHEVSATEILAHRIIWSFVFVTIILALLSKWPIVKEECRAIFRNKKYMLALLASTTLISINWLIFIWAVNNDKVIETSLGYYINPLLVVLLGIVLLKERLNMWQTGSLVLATIGVVIMTVHYGYFPWVAFSLAISFALYGLVKKVVQLSPLLALAFETVLTLPIALMFVSWLHVTNAGTFGMDVTMTWLLIGAGIATALPLLWFAHGARRIPLNMIGFLQYIAPSITLCLGIFVFHEPFSKVQLLSFIFIWTALTVFTLSKTKLFVQLEAKLLRKKMLGT